VQLVAARENQLFHLGIETAAGTQEVGVVSSPVNRLRSPIPMTFILLVALVVHGPLLLMELPLTTYDGNFHIFFASHYAHHWFDPWNPKWFTGFSQTTYPPLPQQWIAAFSPLMGLNLAYMLVQMIAILLLAVGTYRYAKLWVDERAASYAALGSVFLGSLAFLIYQAGQLSTTTAAPLYLNALPYFYEWTRNSKGRALLKGLALTLAAAAAHHVTLLFGAVLFALPVLALAIMDRHREGKVSSIGIMSRAIVFAGMAAVGIGIVLLPYWIALIHNPITQIPIPHASRGNYLLNTTWGMNYWVIPYGALILALPSILTRGSVSRRLRPLFFGFWIALLFGLGGTTPLPRWLLGRAFQVLTFERFTFWATLMALPIAGAIAVDLVDRFNMKAVVGLAIAAGATCALAVAWTTFSPYHPDTSLKVDAVAAFLNRDGHDKYRYLTLGFANQISRLSTLTDAGTVDGDYNSARLLPEMTGYGSAQLTSSKFYGNAGMESLRAMLKHADRYGLKWVFVHDPYYEPLLAFAGWRMVDQFDRGVITVWSKDDVPPAQPGELNLRPALWQGLLWGTLPMGSSIVALLFVLLLPDRQPIAQMVKFVSEEPASIYVPGVKS
jgi:hypothetical protein